MNNTNLFRNTNLGLGAATAVVSNSILFPQETGNSQLFPEAPVAEVTNTELFPAQESNVVNTTLFGAVEEVSESNRNNDVSDQFSHLSDLLLLEGYSNLSDAVLSLSYLYTIGL